MGPQGSCRSTSMSRYFWGTLVFGFGSGGCWNGFFGGSAAGRLLGPAAGPGLSAGVAILERIPICAGLRTGFKRRVVRLLKSVRPKIVELLAGSVVVLCRPAQVVGSRDPNLDMIYGTPVSGCAP